MKIKPIRRGNFPIGYCVLRESADNTQIIRGLKVFDFRCLLPGKPYCAAFSAEGLLLNFDFNRRKKGAPEIPYFGGRSCIGNSGDNLNLFSGKSNSLIWAKRYYAN